MLIWPPGRPWSGCERETKMRPMEDPVSDPEDLNASLSESRSIDLNEIEENRDSIHLKDTEEMDMEDDPVETDNQDSSSLKTSKMKIILMTIFISSLITASIFILNGILVGGGFYGMYLAATSGKDGLVVEKMVIKNLDTMDANVAFQIRINGGWLSRLASFEIEGPTNVKVILPGFSSTGADDPDAVLLEAKIPTMVCARGEKVLKVNGLGVELKDEIPLNELIAWYSNADRDGHLVIKSSIKFSTRAFLVPLSYNYEVDMKIPLSSSNSKATQNSQEIASLDSFKFLPDEDKDMRLRCEMAMKISGNIIPPSVLVDVPSFQFDLAYQKDDQSTDIFKITSDKESFQGGQEKIFKVTFEVTKVDSLTEVLSKVRGEDYNFNLAFSGKSHENSSKLQLWLSSLNVQANVADMVSSARKKIMLSENNSGLTILGEKTSDSEEIESSEISVDTSESSSSPSSIIIGNIFSKPPETKLDPVAIGFERVEGDRELPKFVFKISLSKLFVWHMSGINFSSLRGKLPTIQLKNILVRDVSSDLGGNSEMIAIDINQEDSNEEAIEFCFVISLCNVKDLTQVYSKFMAIQSGADLELSDDMAKLKSLYFTGSDKNIISKLLKVFEIELQLTPEGKIGVRESKLLDTSLAKTKEAIAAISPPAARGAIDWNLTDKDAHAAHHKTDIVLSTSENDFAINLNLELSKNPPLTENPFMRFYWTNIGFSILPAARVSNGSTQEMAKFELSSGQFHVKIANLQPGLLFYDGGVDMKVILRDYTLENIAYGSQDLELIRVWREMFQLWYNGDDSVEYEIVFEVGNKKLQFDSYRTSRKSIIKQVSTTAEITSETEKLIASNFSLAGIRDGNINLLVELPKIAKKYGYDTNKLAITANLKLPSFGVNLCTNKETIRLKKTPLQLDAEDDKDDQKCFFKVGFSKPATITVKYANGQIYDITSSFEEPKSHDISLKNDDEESEDNKMLVLTNLLPMYISIIDLDTALTIMPDLWSSKMNDYPIFFGYPSKESYRDSTIPMIERFLNGFVQNFEWFLPRVSNKNVIEARNVVDKVTRHSQLKTKIEVVSRGRDHAKIDFSIAFPEECFRNLEDEFSSSLPVDRKSKSSLAKMMTLQWGDTELKFMKGNGFVKIHLDQGQISLSKIGSAMADISEMIHFSIEMKFDKKNFSSRNLQNLKNIIVAAFNSRNNRHLYPDYLMDMANKLQKMSFDMELRSRKYVFKKKKRKEADSADDFSITKSFTGGFVLNVMHYIYAFLHKEADKNAKPWDFAFVFRPVPFEDKPIVEIPYLFDYNSPEHAKLMKTPEDERLCQFEIVAKQLTYRLFKMMADTFAFALKNIGMKTHPEKMKITVNIPRMALFGQVNGIDLVEAELDKFTVERSIRLAYKDAFVSNSKDELEAQDDEHIFTGRAYWGPLMKDFADIISPAYLLLESGVSPMIKEHPECDGYNLQNSPITMAFSNESCQETNLISTLFCGWYGEHPLSPMINCLGKGTEDKAVSVDFKSADLEELVIVAKNIHIPWPVPKLHIEISDPVTVEFLFRGNIFLRMYIEKGLYIKEPEFKIPQARVVVSKTGFGALPIDRFSRSFADFMTGLVLGGSVQFTILVHIGKRMTVSIPLFVPQKPAKLAFFDSDNSDVIMPEIEKLLSAIGVGASAYGKASSIFSFTKNVVTSPLYPSEYKLVPGDNSAEVEDRVDVQKRLFKRSVNDDEEEMQENLGEEEDVVSDKDGDLLSCESSTDDEDGKDRIEDDIDQEGDQNPAAAGISSYFYSTWNAVRHPIQAAQNVYTYYRPSKATSAKTIDSAASESFDEESFDENIYTAAGNDSKKSDIDEVLGLTEEFSLKAESILPERRLPKETSLSIMSVNADTTLHNAPSNRDEDSPAMKYLASQLHTLREVKSYKSGEKEWESSFEIADLFSSTLDDMTWIGAAKKFTPNFFHLNPPHSEGTIDKIKFALSFRNDGNINLAVCGQILHLFFHDHDGYYGFTKPIDVLVAPQNEVYARLNVLPKNCSWDGKTGTPNIVQILRCIHLNAANPAVDTPAGCHLKDAQRPTFPIAMSKSGLLQIGDEKTNHDGLCYDVRESNVVVAVVSDYDSTKMFLLDLILNMDDMDIVDPAAPHGDPCDISWGGRRSKNFFVDYPEVQPRALSEDKLISIPDSVRYCEIIFDNGKSNIKILVDITKREVNYQIREQFTNPSEANTWSKAKSISKGMDLMLELDFNEKTVSLIQSLKTVFSLTDHRITKSSKLSYRSLPADSFEFEEAARLGKKVKFQNVLYGVQWDMEPTDLRLGSSLDLYLDCDKPTYTEKDMFGICWKVVADSGDLDHFYDSNRSVCLQIFPATRKIKIRDHSRSQDLCTKVSSGINPNFFPGERHIKVMYHPALENKLVFMSDPTKLGKRFSSSYPVDLGKILDPQPGEKVHVGFFANFASSSDSNHYSLSYKLDYKYVLPNLWKSRVFFTGIETPLPKSDYSVLIKLSDFCGNEMTKSPVGLDVELWPIFNDMNDSDDPCSAAFRWKEHPHGYSRPDRIIEFHLVADTFEIMESPKRYRVPGIVRYVSQGFYEASFKVLWPGRYRIMLSHTLDSPRMTKIPARTLVEKNQKLWIPAKNTHIYVHNYFLLSGKRVE